MEIKSILFPTDFSEGSTQALQYAADLVKFYGSKLYVVHVIQDISDSIGWYVPHPSIDSIYKDIVKDAQKELDRYGIEELRKTKDVDRIVIKGKPHEEIIKFANEKKIDLIIIGTHSRKGMDRILFGSTAAYVVRHAPCSVLTGRLPIYQG
jgi:nucleotide-binding universal stress UspA family protein